MYVLDEPSIGLHQRDNERLIGTLRHLRDLGNSVLVVEHDEDMIRAADHVVDMGPGAGVHGGRVMAQGTPAEVRGQRRIADRPLPGAARCASRCRPAPRRRRRRRADACASSARAATTCRTSTVDIPVGRLTCVTGVSGSGKSTLDQRHPVRGGGARCTAATPSRRRTSASRAWRPSTR